MDLSDMLLGRTRYFYKQKSDLIRKYYECLQEKMPKYSIKHAFPQISQMLNYVINKENQVMTSQEMVNTLTEINHTISENKVHIDSYGDKNTHYCTRDELFYLVNITEGLLKQPQAQADMVDTTTAQQSTNSNTSCKQENPKTSDTACT